MPGNSANAKLNGERGRHVGKDEKRHTSKRRRAAAGREILEQLS